VRAGLLVSGFLPKPPDTPITLKYRAVPDNTGPETAALTPNSASVLVPLSNRLSGVARIGFFVFGDSREIDTLGNAVTRRNGSGPRGQLLLMKCPAPRLGTPLM
jgi:hypothetical protein